MEDLLFDVVAIYQIFFCTAGMFMIAETHTVLKDSESRLTCIMANY